MAEDTTRGQNVIIDHSKLSTSFNKSDKQLIRDCAITLYTNANFDQTEKSNFQIARECIDRAVIIVSELKKSKVI